MLDYDKGVVGTKRVKDIYHRDIYVSSVSINV